MILENIRPAENTPEEINVVIEIPSNSSPVKYEMDKDSGALFVNRFTNVAMFYPCNYGFVPHTLSKDNDPVDVLVVTPVPVMSGCVITCRPIGMLKMEDEAGQDVKILAVPTYGLNTAYETVQTIHEMPGELLNQITRFFEQHKALDPKKWVKIDGWVGAEEARKEIVQGINRYEHVLSFKEVINPQDATIELKLN